MGKVRSVELKHCMRNNLRFNESIRNKKYFSCDVCYTCKSFNLQTDECTLTWDEAKKRAGDRKDLFQVTLGSKYFKTVEIKKPLWYRCSVWEENG